MSHFSVVVAIPEDDMLRRAAVVDADGFRGVIRSALEAKLERVMAPWDENKEVPPYRDYEEGGPADFWVYRSLREDAEAEAAGTPLPEPPDYLGRAIGKTREIAEKAALERARNAALFKALPDPVTWESLVDAMAIMYPGDDEEDERLRVDEDGERAYNMSTYNPQSKWDYWRIGGRWGGYFTCKPEAVKSVISPERDWDSPEKPFDTLSCNAVRRGDLDIEAMKKKGGKQAGERWDGYHLLIDGLPELRPWKEFTAEVDAGRLDIDTARALYREQPRVKALDGNMSYLFTPDTEFDGSRNDYVDQAREGALPGYALVDAAGRWISPGDMGWFGMSSDTPESYALYRMQVNEYIEALPASTWLVALDCHI